MNIEIKEIIVGLISRVYDLESEHFKTVADRNICEAELKEMYEDIESLMGAADAQIVEELAEEIESLEEQVGELANRNEDLVEENYNLRRILTNVSEAINVTWN